MHMSHPCDVPVMYWSSELKACWIHMTWKMPPVTHIHSWSIFKLFSSIFTISINNIYMIWLDLECEQGSPCRFLEPMPVNNSTEFENYYSWMWFWYLLSLFTTWAMTILWFEWHSTSAINWSLTNTKTLLCIHKLPFWQDLCCDLIHTRMFLSWVQLNSIFPTSFFYLSILYV